jgi:hypothetical protein
MTAARTIASGYAADSRDEPVVVAFRPRIGGGHGAGGARARRRRRPAAVILPWPHPWRPRQVGDLDLAIAYAWQQYCGGLIDDIEIMCRDAELRALRESFAKPREERWPE